MSTVNAHETKPAKRLPKGAIRPLQAEKKQKHSSPRIWEGEHIKLLIDAKPELLTTTDPKERHRLLMDAQKVLPKTLQRSYQSLYVTCIRQDQGYETLLGVLEKPKVFKKISDEQRAKMLAGKLKKQLEAKAAAEAEKKRLEAEAEAEKNKRHLVKWKTKEHWPLMAYDSEIKTMLDSDYIPNNVRLVQMVMDAQVRALPREKWRGRSSLLQSCFGKPGLINQLRGGLKFPNPYPPVVATEPEDTMANSLANIELDLEPEGIEQAPPQAAPLPPHVEQIAAGLAMLGSAIRPMLAALMPMLEQTIANALARGLASHQAVSIDPEAITQSVRNTVIDILGAPAQPPAPPAVKPAPKAVPIMVTPTKPRVDVVGLLGDQETVVRNKCGQQFDLRFIGAKEVERQAITAPVAIMCRKFVKHSAQDRIRKAGANLVYANGGADSVVQQLQQMLQ